jgi:inhibitor of KinA
LTGAVVGESLRPALMKWIPYGPHAWLLEFASRPGDEAFARGRAIAGELERHPPAGLVEYVPAFATVLLEFDPATNPGPDLAALAARLQKAAGSRSRPAPVKEIPVRYDGPDLERVASVNGLTVAQVAELHAGTIYKVYLLGFAPGFPYLGDLDPRLRTPRLESPRTRVPAGSVAIGGEHTGIYPVESPGGWNIIGHTTVKLFDPAAIDTPFLLQAGDRLRFVPVAGEGGGA